MAIGTVIGGMRVSALDARGVTLTPIARKIHVTLPEMIRVAGGTFPMGSERWTDTQPIRQVTLTEYAIGKYPVTNAEWLGYLQVIGKTIPQHVANTQLAMHPVVNVSWNDAMDYCKFLMERTGRKFGLPTEAQWEYAARGKQGLEYPWGNSFDASKVVFNTTGTQPVDTYPEGASWCGTMHMSGNVWEWTMNWYADRYDANDLTDPKRPDSGTYKVLRGGSWRYDVSDLLMAAYRFDVVLGGQGDDIGLRLAEDIK